MAGAAESATGGGGLGPFSMGAKIDLYTPLGNRACISALGKTLEPKTWPGVSPGSKLIAGGTYASTLVIAARRTVFPLNGVPIAAMRCIDLSVVCSADTKERRWRKCYAAVKL